MILCYGKGKSKYFGVNMGPLLGRRVSSTFDKKRTTPHSEFSLGTIKLLLRYCQAIIFYQSRPRLLGRDMKQELDISLVKC